MRGVNRHEWHDVKGKAVDDAHMLRDVVLMKRANINAVRCSHYPNADRWCAARACGLPALAAGAWGGAVGLGVQFSRNDRTSTRGVSMKPARELNKPPDQPTIQATNQPASQAASQPTCPPLPHPTPQTEHFPERYELCTRLGLHVVDEANIETHGFDPLFAHDQNHPAHSGAWLGAMMERAARCAGAGRGAVRALWGE